MRKIVLFLLLLAMSRVAIAEFRVWQDRKGNRLEAEYICEVGGKIMLRDPEGKEFRLSLESLSKGDQQYLQRLLPPKLEIAFSKAQDRRKIDSYYSTLDIRCSAEIKKTSRMPYDRELKAVMVVLGYRDKEDEYIVLDRSEYVFKVNQQKTHEFSGTKFQLREYKSYYSTSNRTEYRGYVVGVLDPEEKVVAVKSSSDNFVEKFAMLAKCGNGEKLDRSLNKMKSMRSY